MLAPTTDMVS